MKKDIKRLVSYYVKKYNTRDPFELANYLNVEVQCGNLGKCALTGYQQGRLYYTVPRTQYSFRTKLLYHNPLAPVQVYFLYPFLRRILIWQEERNTQSSQMDTAPSSGFLGRTGRILLGFTLQ